MFMFTVLDTNLLLGQVSENCDEKQQFLVRGKKVQLHNTEEDGENK